jgi:transposase InsO family protein
MTIPDSVLSILSNKRTKSSGVFVFFVARIQTETGELFSSFRTDNGGKYVSNAFKEYLEENGIRHETCAPNTPEQDGVSERSNRTIMESSLSSLLNLNLPFDLWAEATSCSVYV